MKEFIANLVFRTMAAVGLRTFAAQFLVSFVIIFLLLLGIGAGIVRALGEPPAWLETTVELQSDLNSVTLGAAAYVAGDGERRVLERAFSSLDSDLSAVLDALAEDSASLSSEVRETERAWDRYQQVMERLVADPGSVSHRQLHEAGGDLGSTLSVLLGAGLANDHGGRQQGLIFALVLLLGIVGLLFVGRIYGNFHFMDQTERLREHLRLVAEGDFSHTLEIAIHENEVGDMLDAYNTMVERVGALLDEIRQATEHAGNELQQVVDATSKTQQGAEQQNTEVYEAASAMNQMSSSVQEVAGNAQNAADSAHEAASSAREGRQVADQARGRIDNLDTRFAETARTMEGLEKDANDVSQVLTVIREIADQTNLLALNAAIEAARAGESGRGFAVVADEVRNLAQRTQDSTNQIQETIERLQQQVRNLVTESEASAEASRESVEAVNRTTEAIESILSSIENIQGMNDQIATAVEEQSSVAEDINKRVRAISDVAEQTDQDARQTVSSTDAIRGDLERLQRTMKQFKR